MLLHTATCGPAVHNVLKPLTDKAGLKKRENLVWTDEMQIAFDKMKKLMAADAIIAYPWVHKRWVGASGVSGKFESSQNKLADKSCVFPFG